MVEMLSRDSFIRSMAQSMKCFLTGGDFFRNTISLVPLSDSGNTTSRCETSLEKDGANIERCLSGFADGSACRLAARSDRRRSRDSTASCRRAFSKRGYASFERTLRDDSSKERERSLLLCLERVTPHIAGDDLKEKKKKPRVTVTSHKRGRKPARSPQFTEFVGEGSFVAARGNYESVVLFVARVSFDFLEDGYAPQERPLEQKRF